MACLEKIRLWLALIQGEQLLNKYFYRDISRFEVHCLTEDELGVLAELLLNCIKDLAKGMNALSYFRRHLVVWEPELNLLQHREGNGVDKDNTAIDATCVDDKDLLVALLQAEEFGLCIIERAAIVQVNKVLATFVCAYRDTLLREACVLFNVPNLKDPVGV